MACRRLKVLSVVLTVVAASAVGSAPMASAAPVLDAATAPAALSFSFLRSARSSAAGVPSSLSTVPGLYSGVEGNTMTTRAYFTIVGVTVYVQPFSSELVALMMNALPLCWYPPCPLGMASIMPLGAGTAILCLTDRAAA